MQGTEYLLHSDARRGKPVEQQFRGVTPASTPLQYFPDAVHLYCQRFVCNHYRQ